MVDVVEPRRHCCGFAALRHRRQSTNAKTRRKSTFASRFSRDISRVLLRCYCRHLPRHSSLASAGYKSACTVKRLTGKCLALCLQHPARSTSLPAGSWGRARRSCRSCCCPLPARTLARCRAADRRTSPCAWACSTTPCLVLQRRQLSLPRRRCQLQHLPCLPRRHCLQLHRHCLQLTRARCQLRHQRHQHRQRPHLQVALRLRLRLRLRPRALCRRPCNPVLFALGA